MKLVIYIYLSKFLCGKCYILQKIFKFWICRLLRVSFTRSREKPLIFTQRRNKFLDFGSTTDSVKLKRSSGETPSLRAWLCVLPHGSVVGTASSHSPHSEILEFLDQARSTPMGTYDRAYFCSYLPPVRWLCFRVRRGGGNILFKYFRTPHFNIFQMFCEVMSSLHIVVFSCT